jgi:SAM-dependent methyltransferase
MDFVRGHLSMFKQRLLAALNSIRFNPKTLKHQQFLRFRCYEELKRWLPQQFPEDQPAPRIVEFGGSNHVIKSFLPFANYEVAPNWPEVDVQDLAGYQNDFYDAVVLDHVLEHVQDPWRAVAELRRVLKPGGVCISTTPFLIRIHGVPDDYWRFTHDGLKTLFRDFSAVDVFGWGNRLTLDSTMRWGWIDCQTTKRRMRAALWNEAHWPIVYLVRAYR